MTATPLRAQLSASWSVTVLAAATAFAAAVAQPLLRFIETPELADAFTSSPAGGLALLVAMSVIGLAWGMLAPSGEDGVFLHPGATKLAALVFASVASVVAFVLGTEVGRTLAMFSLGLTVAFPFLFSRAYPKPKTAP